MAHYPPWRLFQARNAAKPGLPYNHKIQLEKLQMGHYLVTKEGMYRKGITRNSTPPQQRDQFVESYAFQLAEQSWWTSLYYTGHQNNTTSQQHEYSAMFQQTCGRFQPVQTRWNLNLSRRWLVAIPKHIGLDCIAASFFCCLNKWWPHLQQKSIWGWHWP